MKMLGALQKDLVRNLISEGEVMEVYRSQGGITTIDRFVAWIERVIEYARKEEENENE